MLQLTSEAADLIRELRADNSQGSDALLRVSGQREGDGTGLQLAFVPSASEGDQIGESEGLPVCVAPEVASVLESQVLDVAEAAGGKSLIVRAA